MPKQKDLKRIVRSRMQKTGEAYTAARLQVLKKEESAPDHAALAGSSDAAVSKGSGKTWTEWVRVLDKAGAAEKSHTEIAAYVSSLGTPGWWSQMVTVGYERIRGLRDKGQQRDDSTYELSKSRTFKVPVATLYGKVANPRARARWLPAKIIVRTATPHRTMRVTWSDKTDVHFFFTPKGEGKSTLTVRHLKLRDSGAVAKLKLWWNERLDELSELLA
jgi:uncharacterized protein YndB with AHSA1/START domain